jgi:hypothetical protein
MKPTTQISSNERDSHCDSDALRAHRSSPLTDYSYHSTAGAIDRSSAIAEKANAELRTFRKISRKFFGAEANREYIAEALFFALISCVAAWPVSVMIRQLITMMI